MKHRVRLIEIWKPVVGYEDCYAVSNHGRIKRTKSGHGATVGRILKPKLRKAGYVGVNLYKDEKIKDHLVHRLVLEAFIGLCPPGQECNHICKSGTKTKNYLWNLEWTTHSKNIRHMVDVLGRVTPKGKNNLSSKRYILISPTGLIVNVHGLREFCKDNSLNQSAMVSVAKGRWNHHKGWRCKYDN